jgi:hypothetical protein
MKGMHENSGVLVRAWTIAPDARMRSAVGAVCVESSFA